jgi:hypothetical protein
MSPRLWLNSQVLEDSRLAIRVVNGNVKDLLVVDLVAEAWQLLLHTDRIRIVYVVQVHYG